MIADEIRALAARCALLDATVADAIFAIADRVEAVEREAARYRWLRDARYTAAPSGSLVDLWLFSRPTSSGAGIDSAIDDAIKEQADAT